MSLGISIEDRIIEDRIIEDRIIEVRKKLSTEIIFSLGLLLRGMSLKGSNECEEGLIFLWDL